MTDEGLTIQFYNTIQKDPEVEEDLGKMEYAHEVRTGLKAYVKQQKMKTDVEKMLRKCVM